MTLAHLIATHPFVVGVFFILMISGIALSLTIEELKSSMFTSTMIDEMEEGWIEDGDD